MPAPTPDPTPAPTPAPEPAPTEAEEDTATFLGRPWREMGAVARSALEGTALGVLDQALQDVIDALGPFDAPAGDPSEIVSASDTVACPGGGTIVSTNVRGPSEIGGRGFMITSFYGLDDCALGGRRLAGLASVSLDQGDDRTMSRSRSGREYALTLIDADGSRMVAEGALGQGREVDITQPCRPREDTTREAAFAPGLSVTDPALGVTLLGLSVAEQGLISTDGYTGLSTCTASFETTFRDSALIELADSGRRLEVRQSGATRRVEVVIGEAGVPPATGAVSNAVLELRGVGGPEATLSIAATGAERAVLVTIREGGSVSAFESTWDFTLR